MYLGIHTDAYPPGPLCYNEKMIIDTSLNFADDTDGFWDNFWENNGGLGAGSSDPDIESPLLQKYHQFLWSKELPCGEKMELKKGDKYNYLTWKNYRFGSDSILVSFRYKRNYILLKEVEESVDNYHLFVEGYVKKLYTIGATTIFPKHSNSINQSKGCNKYICDRLDLTLECIRRFYNNDESPLYDVLKNDANFFKLFVDFKGFVDYFFFQDLVTSNYDRVLFWIENDNFKNENPMPKTVEQYLNFIDDEIIFSEKRNKRIRDWAAVQ